MLCITTFAVAQKPVTATPANTDSSKIVHLLHADKTIGLQPKGADSSQLLKFIGNVLFQQGNTTFTCDSANQNLTKNLIDAVGHIHINEDSVNIYSDSLHYNASTRMASLRKKVQLTDGKMILTTPQLDYDLNAKIGTYAGGGKLVNGGTVLVSDIGYYYADTKEAYFKKNVVVTDPQYTLHTDTLLYNTQTRVTTFIAPATVNNGQSVMYTSAGYYDTQQGISVLWNRPTVIDSSQTTTADSLFYNKLTGIDSAKGNVVWTDTVQKATILSNYALYNENTRTLLSAEKPLLIYQMDKDTLYTASDTLFSGVRKLKDTDTLLQKDTATYTISKKGDTLSRKVIPADTASLSDSTYRYFLAYHNVRIFSDSLQGAADSLYYSFRDSTFRMYYNPVIWTGDNQLTGDSIFLHTKNKKAEKLELRRNAMIVSKAGPDLYDQIKGNNIDGYFADNKLDRMHVNGSAENIYYPKDDLGGYLGVNKTSAGMIDIYFKNGELNKVSWRQDVEGSLLPITQIKPKDMLLRNFKWEADRRPLSKEELMK